MQTNTSTVPFEDRRKGKRILTRKNSLRAAIGLAIVFVTISASSELYRSGQPDQYGRLYQNRPKVTELPVRQPQVIVEEKAPVQIRDDAYADPLSVDTINREQILGASTTTLDPRYGVQADTAYVQDFTPDQPLALGVPPQKRYSGSRFSIEGGSAGVYTRTSN